MSDYLHISSIVITADPAHHNKVDAAINEMPSAEIAASGPAGKSIVTLETDDEKTMVQALTDIQLLPGVHSAALVYHQATTTVEASAVFQPSEKKLWLN